MADMEISYRFSDAPAWLDKLTFSRGDGFVCVEALRKSGTLLGEVHIPADVFRAIADMFAKS